MLQRRFLLPMLIAAAACTWGLPSPADAQWSYDGLRIAPSDSVQSDPVVAPDGAGGVFVAWQDYRSGQSNLFAQYLSSAGIPAPGWPANGLQLSTGIEYDPVITTDGQGGAFVAATNASSIGLWRIASAPATGGASVVALSRVESSTDSVIFGGAQPAAIAKSSPTVLPMLLPDGAGGVFVAWEQGGFLNEYPAAQHFNADGSVAYPWPAGRLILGYGYDPVLCTDGANGLIVARAGLWAMRVSVLSDTVVAGWPGGWILVAPAAGFKDAPGIVSDGAGGAILVWQDPRNGSYEQVYAQHLTASGTVSPGWADSGLAVCTFPTDAGLTRYSPRNRRPQRYSAVASDGVGGALIAWRDMRADSGDVYVQHLLPDGTIAAGWPKNGLAVCTAPGIQMAPSITSDGAGGAFVSWQDDRSVDGWRAYAQHVLSSGATAPGWSENGVLVCTGPGDHLIPRSAPDEAGGAVVAWQDMRYASTGIYAARLGADGALLAAGPCDAAASVVTTSADSGTVRIVWHVNHPGVAVVLCRQVDGPWMPVRKILTDELGTVDYSDQDAIAGCRYGYALDVSACGAPPQVMGELWIDIPEGAGFAPLSASAQPAVAEAGRVRLSWEIAGGEGLTATVFRRDSCSTWNSLGTADVDDFGVAHFDDQSLFEGHSVDYRLVVHACGRDTSLAESWVEIPSGQGFIPTAAELISAMAGPSDAHLLWQKQSGPSCIARIYRRDSTTSIWTLRGEPEIDVGGAIRFDDLGLQPGMRYEYQLGLWSCGRERLFGPAGVQIPRFDLALRGSWPNPARASLSIPFTLESADPATLELFDVGGRLISRRSVGTLGPGEHVFVLDHPTLAAGLYLIRLTQGGRALTARAVVLR